MGGGMKIVQKAGWEWDTHGQAHQEVDERNAVEVGSHMI